MSLLHWLAVMYVAGWAWFSVLAGTRIFARATRENPDFLRLPMWVRVILAMVSSVTVASVWPLQLIKELRRTKWQH